MNCFVYTNKSTLKKGARERTGAREGDTQGAARFFLCPLLPSACYAGYRNPDSLKVNASTISPITLLEKCLKTILLFKSDKLISVKIKKSSRLKNVLSNFAILDQTRISSAKRDTVVATFHTRGAEGQQKAPLLSYFFYNLIF